MSETPLAWFNLAHAYLHDAAILKAASKSSAGFYEEPVWFLYFNSIELFPKVYLRLQGIEESEPVDRPYSYCLTNLADEAERRGLAVGKRVRLLCMQPNISISLQGRAKSRLDPSPRILCISFTKPPENYSPGSKRRFARPVFPCPDLPGSRSLILRGRSQSPRLQSCSRVGLQSSDKAMQLG
jgi:hypothetical protein